MVLLDAAVVLVILLRSSMLGLFLRPLLSERHRSREVIEVVQLVVAMLVTFAALVLGLLTSSVKASFDKVGDDLRGLAIQLIQLDRSLREWGAEAQPARDLLRAYTAVAIATTWTREAKPSGDYYPREAPAGPGSQLESLVTDDLLARIEAAIRQFEPRDPMHHRLLTTSISQFERLMHTRWQLIEETGSSISTPFYVVLVFWLAIVFGSFGLNAPRNALTYTIILLGGISTTSAMSLILELDTPFEGLFTVSSQPMRDALTYLSR
jgi:Protein of unknown function (DUF4239)